MRAGLVGRDLAGVHELLDIGVVVRHADDGAAAQQVDAGIAHVGDGHLALLQKAAGGGAAHAGLAHAVLGALDDGGVRGLDGGPEEHVVGAGGRLLGNGSHGDGARDLARGMSAHAVAHGKEGCLDEEGVLVVAAHKTHVGTRAPAEGRARALHGVRAGAALDGHLGAAGRVGGLLGCGVVQLVRAHPRLTLMMVSPTCTSSASRSVTAWVMGWPLTRVPLVEPRSSRTRAGPCRVKRACDDET